MVPDELEQEPGGQPVEAPAHLAVAAQAHLDARARPQHLAHAREDGARVALLAHVRRGARAELAHALQQVLLPREQDDRRVAQRDVAAQRAAEREAVEARHQDVAHDELGLDAEREVERGGAVERLVHLAARGAQQVGDEPGDARDRRRPRRRAAR